jgi:hypothetical protein
MVKNAYASHTNHEIFIFNKVFIVQIGIMLEQSSLLDFVALRVFKIPHLLNKNCQLFCLLTEGGEVGF